MGGMIIFMKMFSKRNLAILSIASVIVMIWLIWGNTNIETTKYIIESKKIPSSFNGFKIAQVSDFHNKEWDNKLIDILKSESPDIIVITGDFIDSYRTNIDISAKLIDDAIKIAPIYYVTGNHESRISEYPMFKQMLISKCVIMLEDERADIELNDETISILGINDPSFGVSIDSTIKSINYSEQNFNILLSHRPEAFEKYVSNSIDLTLTGHAHGGQIVLPFVGALVAPDQGFFPSYTDGIHIEKNSTMIISRGLGNSIIPIRFNNMSELVIVELKG